MKISLEQVNSAVRKSSLEILGVALVLMIVVIACIFVFINRALTVPLRRLSHSLSEIADGDGDLTRRLDAQGKDEIGETSAIFNTFMEKLQSVVREVKSSAEQVLATATQMAGASQQVTNSSNHQSDATASMAASIEEITVSVGHVAENAQSAQEMAVNAGGLSGEGAVAVRNAVSEMNKIADSVVRSAQVIRELGDKSAQISSIVNVIKEIAEQTNLLALNAAIERRVLGNRGVASL